MAYTGGGPGEFYIQEDKALAKKLLAFDRVPYPPFAVFGEGEDLETGGRLRMPLFVKPLRMDASIGIDRKSLVHSTAELLERVRHIHKKVGDDALAEEYIEGRELYVGVLGNNSHAKPLPPVEMDFSGMPEGKPHVLDAKAKWDEKSPEYKGSRAASSSGMAASTALVPLYSALFSSHLARASRMCGLPSGMPEKSISMGGNAVGCWLPRTPT